VHWWISNNFIARQIFCSHTANFAKSLLAAAAAAALKLAKARERARERKKDFHFRVLRLHAACSQPGEQFAWGSLSLSLPLGDRAAPQRVVCERIYQTHLGKILINWNRCRKVNFRRAKGNFQGKGSPSLNWHLWSTPLLMEYLKCTKTRLMINKIRRF
jgi:hypothetical protein